MYKKILVPLDGSGLAECVFQHVIDIAKGCEAAEVDLLYVVGQFIAPFDEFSVIGTMETAPTGNLRTVGTERYMKWGKEYLDRVAATFAKDGVPARSVVIRGNPADCILNYVRDNNIDLVIMATHGRSGPAKWTLGSVADRVLRQSTSPVMIVRPQECAVTL